MDRDITGSLANLPPLAEENNVPTANNHTQEALPTDPARSGLRPPPLLIKPLQPLNKQQHQPFSEFDAFFTHVRNTGIVLTGTDPNHRPQISRESTDPPVSPAESVSSVNVSVKPRKVQQRFAHEDDMVLLQEVHAVFPYGSRHGTKTSSWNTVAKNVRWKLDVDGRRCRERSELLLQKYQSGSWSKGDPRSDLCAKIIRDMNIARQDQNQPVKNGNPNHANRDYSHNAMLDKPTLPPLKRLAECEVQSNSIPDQGCMSNPGLSKRACVEAITPDGRSTMARAHSDVRRFEGMTKAQPEHQQAHHQLWPTPTPSAHSPFMTPGCVQPSPPSGRPAPVPFSCSQPYFVPQSPSDSQRQQLALLERVARNQEKTLEAITRNSELLERIARNQERQTELFGGNKPPGLDCLFQNQERTFQLMQKDSFVQGEMLKMLIKIGDAFGPEEDDEGEVHKLLDLSLGERTPRHVKCTRKDHANHAGDAEHRRAPLKRKCRSV